MIVGILLMLLNFGLLAIPIGGTLGALAGVDGYRRAHGQEALFPHSSSSGSVGSDNSGGGDGGDGDGDSTGSGSGTGNKPNATTVIGGVTVKEYCQQYAQVSVNTTSGQNYTLNPNQWGWTKSDGGGLCLNVTTNNNNTYSSNVTAPHWSAIWQYEKGPDTQPVHAFPNIKIAGDVFPAKLGDLTEMVIDLEWSYTSGNTVIGGSTTASASATATTAETAATAATAATSAADVLSSLESSASAAEETSTAVAKTTTAAATAATIATSAAADAASSATGAAAAVADTATSAAVGTTTAVTTSAAAAATTATTAGIARRAINTTTVDFNANVAIDMFFDAKESVSSETGTAAYEVMVWFGKFGAYTDPIGYSNGTVTFQVIENVNFTLYTGTNSYDQYVYTWVAEEPATSFNGDILPLITSLSTMGLTDVPSSTDYIGYFSFGTEAYYADNEVTFDVASLSMDIW